MQAEVIDVISVADEIQKKIKLLEKMRMQIKERGINKANSISEYRKALAIKIIELKNMSKDDVIEFEGKKIKGNIPITIIKEIARGLCFKEKLKEEESSALYSSAITNINTVQAELSSLQSLFRFLDRA